MKNVNSIRKREIRDRLLKLANYKCEYCGVKVDKKSYTFDHWVPQSKGGCNGISNLRISCGPCNAEKADMDPWDWTLRKEKERTQV